MTGLRAPTRSECVTDVMPEWPVADERAQAVGPTQVAALEPERGTYVRDRRPPVQDHAERG
jgi:hypothetical protein